MTGGADHYCGFCGHGDDGGRVGWVLGGSLISARFSWRVFPLALLLSALGVLTGSLNAASESRVFSQLYIISLINEALLKLFAAPNVKWSILTLFFFLGCFARSRSSRGRITLVELTHSLSRGCSSDDLNLQHKNEQYSDLIITVRLASPGMIACFHLQQGSCVQIIMSHQTESRQWRQRRRRPYTICTPHSDLANK